jgi:ATP-dependent DNA helicase RecQ
MQTLERVWGFDTLKPGQQRVLDAILAEDDNDIICGFPTGYGKSLCYILPAIHANACCVVVSPLCSLIQDQTTKINTLCGNKIAYNMSTVDGDKDCDVQVAITGSGPVLIFSTPERIQSQSMQSLLQVVKHARTESYIVLDEAHLLTEQGYSFRADYLRLGCMRSLLPGARMFCFTATSTSFVRKDLCSTLHMKHVLYFAEPDLRDNLKLTAHVTRKGAKKCSCTDEACLWHLYAKSNPCQCLHRLVSGFAGGEVLVFAVSRRDVEDLSAGLQARLPTKHIEFYHAGLDGDTRTGVQTRFLQGEIDILVATMASFGTGVDMPAVKNVIIHNLPSSVHTLVQTIGRGGRNGLPYTVHLFATEAELCKARVMLQRDIERCKHAAYARYMSDSFQMVERIVFSVVHHGQCLLALLSRAGEMESHNIRVPFTDISQFKTQNAKALRVDRAKWDSKQKTWYLPVGASGSHLPKWCTERESTLSRCTNRCTTCLAPLSKQTRKRLKSPLK